MAQYDRRDIGRPMPSTRMSLLLAAVAAIVLVLGIYSVSHSVDPAAESLPWATPTPSGN